jgi:hypothetical protein
LNTAAWDEKRSRSEDLSPGLSHHNEPKLAQ